MNNKIFLKWPLIIGIVIVLNLFFNYVIKVVYPGKDYQDFCPQAQKMEKILSAEACINRGGQWDESSFSPDEGPGYCNRDFICSQQHKNFLKIYEKNVFIILVVFGAIFLGASFLTGINQVLSTAFSLGGVLSFVIASMRYWQFAEDWLHLLILGLALGALIWLGVRKFKDIDEK